MILQVLSALVLAGAPPPATAAKPTAANPAAASPSASPSPTAECAPGDHACLRRVYQALGGDVSPDAPVCVEDEAAPERGITVKDDKPVAKGPCPAGMRPQAPGARGQELPWWVIGPAQWGVTLVMDLLPALLFAATAVVFVLPASTVPTLIVGALALGSIPGLPLVEGLATNLVGDVLSRGERRGRLVVQLATSVGVLGSQLLLGVVGFLATGLLVNVLAVQFTAPEARYLPWKCNDPVNQFSRCTEQVGRVSEASTLPVLAAAAGVLGVVTGNLLLAVVFKGPLLALAWQLHATRPWPAPWPIFLPRLATTEEPPRTEDTRALAQAPTAGPTG